MADGKSRAYIAGWNDAIREALDVLTMVLDEREGKANMAWEWHERKRDVDGKFMRKDPDGGTPTTTICLRLPVDVIDQLRRDAGAHHCEYGKYVTHALKQFWKAPRGPIG